MVLIGKTSAEVKIILTLILILILNLRRGTRMRMRMRMKTKTPSLPQKRGMKAFNESAENRSAGWLHPSLCGEVVGMLMVESL